MVRIGDALLPTAVRQAVKAAVDKQRSDRPDEKNNALRESEVLEAMTAIRRQTAIDPDGTPREGSLRATRVVLREAVFDAQLSFDFDPSTAANRREMALLVACTASLRRVGSGRNRGRGRVAAMLILRTVDGETDLTLEGVKNFADLTKETK